MLVKENEFIVTIGILGVITKPYKSKINPLIIMKKEVVITVRVDSEVDKIIRALAKKDDRTIAWITRKLISEGLESRGLLKNKD